MVNKIHRWWMNLTTISSGHPHLPDPQQKTLTNNSGSEWLSQLNSGHRNITVVRHGSTTTFVQRPFQDQRGQEDMAWIQQQYILVNIIIVRLWVMWIQQVSILSCEFNKFQYCLQFTWTQYLWPYPSLEKQTFKIPDYLFKLLHQGIVGNRVI